MALRHDEVPAGLEPILLPGEKLVTAVHAHWVSVAEPIVSMFLGLIVAIWVDSNVTHSTQAVGTIVWLGFIFLVLRMLWQLADWHHNWFVATDKRLLLRYGIITHKVAMMPLIKVTDMSYVRSIPGQFLGYGRFVLESAGQDQALREIKWVPHPDETYRAICAEIFHIAPPPGPVDGDDADPDLDDFGDTGGPGGPGAPGAGGSTGYGGYPGAVPGGYVPPVSPITTTRQSSDSAYPDVHGTHDPIQERLDSYSRAVPIQKRKDGETVYESEDIKRRRRGADTGPIWPQS
ncbi:PH domain-containing protein [Humibacillus xanthopallidus]|uniref:PH (Pleckstrin Homology) domain-containing protein n=1 Tax=Humibacillus xanthopallidus TaxID=412689 RepID=A0A543I237_9MICO|nr:PH domain-containing protein [Humibacillus xanthopallidus]TQM64641.1 PH (Pleckstrin Homology) domain-containing protein [Humibacillus xanthopallidus]